MKRPSICQVLAGWAAWQLAEKNNTTINTAFDPILPDPTQTPSFSSLTQIVSLHLAPLSSPRIASLCLSSSPASPYSNISNTMARFQSSRRNNRRDSRPRARRPRHHRSTRRGHPQVSRHHFQASRGRSPPLWGRFPHHQPPPSPVADASPLESGLGSQEPGARENPVIILDDATTAASPELEPESHIVSFITITKILVPGWWGGHHVHVDQEELVVSGQRLAESRSESSAIWNFMTNSVSFAVVDKDPLEAAKRVFRRLFGRRIRRAESIEEDLEDLQPRRNGMMVDITWTGRKQVYEGILTAASLTICYCPDSINRPLYPIISSNVKARRLSYRKAPE